MRLIIFGINKVQIIIIIIYQLQQPIIQTRFMMLFIQSLI